MRTGILIVILITISLIARGQEDPQFSQNMFNHMTINPAFAGEHGRWQVSGIYRNQWQKMDGAPETYAFNVDVPLKIKKMNGGIGLNVMSDKLGMQTNLHLMLNYAYKVKFGFGGLSVGAKIGIINAKIEGEFYIPDQNAEDDPAIGEASKMLFDAGLGAFLTGEKYYAGMSLSHLTKPGMTLGETGEFFFARHMYFTGGYTFTLSPKFDIQPSAFIKTDFVSSQYSVNSNVVYNKMYWGGLSYRYQEAIVFMGGMEMKNGLTVGYSYDWNVSETGQYTGGSHEVSLSYSFGMNFGKKQRIYKSVRFL